MLGIILAIIAAICVGLVLLGLWLWDTEPIYPEGLQVNKSIFVKISKSLN